MIVIFTQPGRNAVMVCGSSSEDEARDALGQFLAEQGDDNPDAWSSVSASDLSIIELTDQIH